MVLDEYNSERGRKPLSIDLNALSAGDWIVMDTTELVALFGIPPDMHLVIDLLSFSSDAADAGNPFTFVADFVRDDSEDPPDLPGLTPDLPNRAALGVWFHIINAANTAVAMTPVDIYNTFAFQDITGGTGSVLMVWFHHEPEGMDFLQENLDGKVDVRQLEPIQGDPGDMYHQLDAYRNQVYSGGVN